MKLSSFLFVVLLAMVFATSCEKNGITSSGELETIDISIRDFEHLEVQDAFKVYVTFSDTEEDLYFKVDKNAVDQVIAEKSGQALVLRLKNNTNFRGNVTLEAHLTINSLAKIKASDATEIIVQSEWDQSEVELDLNDASKLTANSITADQVKMTLTDASQLKIQSMIEASKLDASIKDASELEGAIFVQTFNANLSDASELTLSGTAEEAYMDAGGASKIKDYDLSIEYLDIDLRSESRANLTVTGSMDVKASGNSKLRYKGDATINSSELRENAEIIKIEG